MLKEIYSFYCYSAALNVNYHFIDFYNFQDIIVKHTNCTIDNYFGSNFIYLTFRNYVVNLVISFINFAWKKFSKLFCSVLPWLLVVTGRCIHCLRKYGGTPYVTLSDLNSHIAEINYLTIYTDCKNKALILLMFIFIIHFFTLPTFFPLYPPFMYSGTIWLPYSAGAICCTPEAVIYGAQDHFRDIYIPNPNNLILYYDLQSAYVINDNYTTFYIELILYKYLSILNFSHKLLSPDIKGISLKSHIVNIVNYYPPQVHFRRDIFHACKYSKCMINLLLERFYMILTTVHGYETQITIFILCIYNSLYLAGKYIFCDIFQFTEIDKLYSLILLDISWTNTLYGYWALFTFFAERFLPLSDEITYHFLFSITPYQNVYYYKQLPKLIDILHVNIIINYISESILTKKILSYIISSMPLEFFL